LCGEELLNAFKVFGDIDLLRADIETLAAHTHFSRIFPADSASLPMLLISTPSIAALYCLKTPEGLMPSGQTLAQ